MLYVNCRSTIALPQVPFHYEVKVDFRLYPEHASFLSQIELAQAIISWLLLRQAHKIMAIPILLVKASHVTNPLLMGQGVILFPRKQCRHMSMDGDG